VAALTVAAVVISRGDTETLNQTLFALQSQTHPLQQVVVVEAANDQDCIELAKSFGFGVVSADTKRQGAAINAGISALQGDPGWIWILHHDSAPEEAALAQLSRAAEISPSVGIIGPKLLDWNHPIQIRQLGLTVTKSSRPFTLVEDEYDQGQFDTVGDTLAVSIAGMLVAFGVWQRIGGINDDSPGFAQDIEFCIKARALGFRVIVEPGARVRSAGSMINNSDSRKRRFGGRSGSLAKAHTHLATLLWPAWLLPILYLAMPVVAIFSIPIHLVQKRPARIVGQLSAWLFSWFTIGKRLSARTQLRTFGSLAPLRQLFATREQVANRRLRRFEEEPEPKSKAPGIWESRSIWLAIFPLAVSFALIPQGAIYADRLIPLGRSLDSIWSNASSQSVQYLNGVSLPSDPFNWFFALVALFWPDSPSTSLSWFILISPTLAFIGAWLLASTISSSSWVNNAISLTYSLAAPILLLQRDALVVELVVHAFLPWASYFLVKAAFAFNLSRSWRWIGLAGLAGAFIAISSPLLFGALIVVSLALGLQRIRRLGVLIWFAAPGLALIAPWAQFAWSNQAFEFLTVTSSAQAAPIALYQDFVWLSLLAGLALIALAGSISRLKLALPLWGLAIVLLYASSLQPVAGAVGTVVGLLLVLIVLIAIGLESLSSRPMMILGASSLIVSSMGSALLFGAMQPKTFDYGQERQMPALVVAASDANSETRTLRIDLLSDQIEIDYLWGDGRSQDEISVLYEFFRPRGEFDSQLAQFAGSLIAGNPAGVSDLNKVLGVDFVLVVGENELSRQVAVALNSMTILQPSGQTQFGQLWSFISSSDALHSEVQPHDLRELQIAALAAFALLAIPTPGSITGRRRVRST
jgi:GT2 family glycosyltransferase